MAGFSAVLSISRLSPLITPLRFKRYTGLGFKCQAGSSPQMDSDSTQKGSLSQVDSDSTQKKGSLSGISSYTLSAALAGLGSLETGYLSYLKLTNSNVFCPIGSGTCGDVLDSDYSFVFGIPLPLVGLVAYSAVTLLSLQQLGIFSIPGVNKTDSRLLLIGTTTSMATASAYFLYLLSTKFEGTSCSYCLISAFISFTLFFLLLKDYGLEKIGKLLGLQLAVAGMVIAALTNTYSSITPQSRSAEEFTLERYETEITKESTPFAIALAKHLHSIGAKMYGAFWCSHCNEQKEMFGKEAVKILNYVECFPDGAGKGRTMAVDCAVVGIEGFPTWIIKDQMYVSLRINGTVRLKDGLRCFPREMLRPKA
ncbi:Thiol-disulfide oxidoreductase LTO1 [Rhynchospora pubera]|uniref:Thiol-disulfide oxidoreductase LTO1 n=1 Tax=Rhynchospora pubera TaxID=906938 RepID=A0AAV8EC80_9POAL|nr:Thiol-disulfide oxidoreductase LTO1 [Rhynchospora pubera]